MMVVVWFVKNPDLVVYVLIVSVQSVIGIMRTVTVS